MIDLRNPQTVYAGSPYGVFKSTNGGSSWRAVAHFLNVSALAIDPLDPQTIYAGTDGSWVFKSTNGGQSWRAADSSLPGLYVQALAIDPKNPQTIYVGTRVGVVSEKHERGCELARCQRQSQRCIRDGYRAGDRSDTPADHLCGDQRRRRHEHGRWEALATLQDESGCLGCRAHDRSTASAGRVRSGLGTHLQEHQQRPMSSDARRARELFAELDQRFDDDPALARRVVVALEKAAVEPRGSRRRAPAIMDPFELYRRDPVALQPALEQLDIEQLKDVVAQYAMDARRLALKWKTPERLIELIERVVDQRMRKGEAFRS